MDWLQTLTDSFAARAGLDPASLTLSPADRRAILDVARVASHVSGERINAPLLCYVLGLAAGRGVALAASAPLAVSLAEATGPAPGVQ